MAYTNEKKTTKIAEFLPYLHLPVAQNEHTKIVPIKTEGLMAQSSEDKNEKSASPVEQELQSMYKDINAAIEDTKAKLLEVFQLELQKTLREATSRASEKLQAVPTDPNTESPRYVSSTLRLIEGGLLSKAQSPAHLTKEDGKELASSTDDSDAEEHEDKQQATTDILNGTVKLSVNSYGQMRQALQFVQCLYQKPQLRLIRLVGNYKDRLDIWIGLREPVCMREYLMQMKDVAKVVDMSAVEAKDIEQTFEVQLKLAS